MAMPKSIIGKFFGIIRPSLPLYHYWGVVIVVVIWFVVYDYVVICISCMSV